MDRLAMDALFFRGQSSSINGFHYNLDTISDDPLSRDVINDCQFENRSGADVSCPDQNCDGGSQVEGDYFDGVFNYIQKMLMEEEDLEDKPCMLQDCLALQAAERIFYKALHEGTSYDCRSPTPAFLGQDFDNPTDDFANIWSNNRESNGFSEGIGHFVHYQTNFQPIGPLDSISSNFCFQSSKPAMASEGHESYEMTYRRVAGHVRNSGEKTSGEGKTNHAREDNGNDQDADQSSSKKFAGYTEEIDQTEAYDDALLCPDRDPNFYGESQSLANVGTAGKEPKFQPQKAKRGRPKACEKRSNIGEVVDLRDLLTRSAHAVATYDNATVQELLKKIRQHSSPYGDATQRLAHCFANAFEARVSGMGTALYTSLATKRASASDILQAYQTYLNVCPFQRMSNIFANKTIAKLTSTARTVHIIDFGILYGFQWPCIIHGISLRPGGPPKLKITGIDLPQTGFRPAERIEETGRRLANFCKRFNVPFEFNAIAKRWDAISLEEFKIQEDEIVVVNCLYRLRNTPDETVSDSSPRDAVMNLIKNINPSLFVHGILNAGYNAPFFATRFKEALHHFSSLFDMFEVTVPREDQQRLTFEKEVLGRDVMNVIACEGTERVDRPDTYKKWQVRNQRAGFRQLPLNKKIMEEIRVKVRSYYHKEFLVDEDSNWMLQGWKGRVIYALSCWKPA